MAKNMDMTRNGNIVVPLVVPAGTVAGEVLPIGAGGLMGYSLTDRQPAPDYLGEESYVHGLEETEASVELLGVNLVVRLTVATAVDPGDAVYVVDATPGVYTTVDTAATLIGWAINTTSGAGIARVALRPSA